MADAIVANLQCLNSNELTQRVRERAEVIGGRSAFNFAGHPSRSRDHRYSIYDRFISTADT